MMMFDMRSLAPKDIFSFLSQGVLWMGLAFHWSVGAQDWLPICGQLLKQTETPLLLEKSWQLSEDPARAPKRPEIQDYKYRGDKFLKRPKDQCSYGSCWATSALHVVEDVAAQNGAVALDLSIEFVVAQGLLQQASFQVYEFLRLHRKSYVSEGQLTGRGFEVIGTFGVVPEYAWEPRVKLGKDSRGDARFLNAIRFEQEKVYERLTQLAEVYDRLRKSKSSNDPALPHFRELPEVQSAISQLKENVWNVIVSYLGEPPRQFAYHAQSYTPLQFLKSDIFESAYLKKMLSGKFNSEFNGHMAIETLQLMIDRGQMPVISIDVLPWACDGSLGLISLKHHLPTGCSPDLARSLNKPEGGYGRHAVAVVDYKLDPRGRVEWFLLKDSYGARARDHGYYHVDRETFLEIFNEMPVPVGSE